MRTTSNSCLRKKSSKKKMIDKRLPYSLLSGAVLRRARWRFPFLLKRYLDDVIQVAAIVRFLTPAGGVNESKLADRELYALARAYGYRRPSVGLPRGKIGPWRRCV